MGDDDDSSDTSQPQPARKNPKRKQVKPLETAIVQNNEVDGALDDDDETEELVRPAQADSSDDEEEDDEGSLIALFAKNSVEIIILLKFIVCRRRWNFWYSRWYV